MIHMQDRYSLAAQEDRCSPRTKLSIPAQLRASGGRPIRTVVHDLSISGFSAAESRIRDTDVASEAANLTKAQVLVQASMAAMAQANSAPQAVLSLLRG